MTSRASRRSLVLLIVLCLPSLITTPSAATAPSIQAATHPLDPLTSDEISAAAKIIRSYKEGGWQFPDDALFASLVLKEPAKSDVLAFKAGASFPRQVSA